MEGKREKEDSVKVNFQVFTEAPCEGVAIYWNSEHTGERGGLLGKSETSVKHLDGDTEVK